MSSSSSSSSSSENERASDSYASDSVNSNPTEKKKKKKKDSSSEDDRVETSSEEEEEEQQQQQEEEEEGEQQQQEEEEEEEEEEEDKAEAKDQLQRSLQAKKTDLSDSDGKPLFESEPAAAMEVTPKKGGARSLKRLINEVIKERDLNDVSSKKKKSSETALSEKDKGTKPHDQHVLEVSGKTGDGVEPKLQADAVKAVIALLKAEMLSSCTQLVSDEASRFQQVDWIPNWKKKEWDDKHKRLHIEEFDIFVKKIKLTLEKADFVLECFKLCTC